MVLTNVVLSITNLWHAFSEFVLSSRISCFFRFLRRFKNQYLITFTTGPWFNINCGDKTVVRSSYLHNGISYTGKMPSLYWIGALDYLGRMNYWRRFAVCHKFLDGITAEIYRLYLRGNDTSLLLWKLWRWSLVRPTRNVPDIQIVMHAKQVL